VVGFLRSLLVESIDNRRASQLYREWLVDPWVRFELIDGGPLVSVVGEHSQDQVLEIVREVVTTDLFPVGIELVIEDQIVEVFVFLGLLKWENSLHDDEQNDTCGEDVDLTAIVLFAFLYFWSHVRHCSSIGLQFVDLFVSGEAEIGNFKVDLVINQDIFKFQVAVNHVFALHVTKDIQHLCQEVATGVFAHSTAGLAKVKEKTTRNILE